MAYNSPTYITLQDLQHDHVHVTCVEQCAWGSTYGFIDVHFIDHSKENKYGESLWAKHKIKCTWEEARKAIVKSELWLNHAFDASDKKCP